MRLQIFMLIGVNTFSRLNESNQISESFNAWLEGKAVNLCTLSLNKLYVLDFSDEPGKEKEG